MFFQEIKAMGTNLVRQHMNRFALLPRRPFRYQFTLQDKLTNFSLVYRLPLLRVRGRVPGNKTRPGCEWGLMVTCVRVDIAGFGLRFLRSSVLTVIVR